jgi:glycine/D-amino acid oxidase-like deaminating enzyme
MKKYEVIVIGGGLMGLSCAINLASYGKKVCILEKEYCGSGQTGFSGGQVLDGYEISMEELKNRFGYDEANSLYNFSRISREMLRKELENSKAIVGNGNLVVALNDTQEMQIQRDLNLNITNLRKKFIDKDNIKDYIDSPIVQSAVYDKDAFQINPKEMIQNLMNKAIEMGVEICEYMEVNNILGCRVSTNQENYFADYIVLAAGLGTDKILKNKFTSRVYPIKTMMGEIDKFDHFQIKNNYCIYDARNVGSYFRKTDDKFFFGCCDSQFGMSKSTINRKIAKEFNKFFPQNRIESIRGYQKEIDVTLSRLPHFEHRGNLYIAYGLNGHGLALAYGIGNQIANHITFGTSYYYDIMDKYFKTKRFLKVPILGPLVASLIINIMKLFDRT